MAAHDQGVLDGAAPTPAVSVVVPHYGDPASAVALLEQLRDQQGVELELVVSDDASPQPFPDHAVDVTVVRRESNGGFGAAVNSGAAVATHELLLILNSDLDVGPTFVRDLVDAAAPWQPCVAGPAIRRPDGTVDPTGRHFPTTTHQTVEWLTPLARYRHLDVLHEAVGHDLSAAPGSITPVDWVVGAALLLPTGAFRAVGGFDETFYMNAEEVDLQRRLRDLDVPSVYVGTVTAVHESGGSSDPGRRRQWLVDGRMTYAAKWGGQRRLLAALRAATVVNLGANAARRLAGRDIDPMGTARAELALIRGGSR